MPEITTVGLQTAHQIDEIRAWLRMTTANSALEKSDKMIAILGELGITPDFAQNPETRALLEQLLTLHEE